MKNLFNFFFIALAVTLIGSCTANNTDTEGDLSNKSITGEVQEIQPGKDGYTAKIVTDDNQVYFAIISIVNLDKNGNANQFREVKIGETISVKGDVWEMDDETHVTVRELK